MSRVRLATDVSDKLRAEPPTESVPKLVGPYVTISREAGAGGATIAKMVGEAMGWEVLDKELLQLMAEQHHQNFSNLEAIDEKNIGWFRNVFGNWLDHHLPTQEKYAIDLGQTALMAAHLGKVIFVGRGTNFLLPRTNGLAVRVIAPEKFRIDHTMRMKNCTREQAKRFIDETERARRDFVRTYFHRDITDPHAYDLLVNVENLGFQGATDLIVYTVNKRLPVH